MCGRRKATQIGSVITRLISVLRTLRKPCLWPMSGESIESEAIPKAGSPEMIGFFRDVSALGCDGGAAARIGVGIEGKWKRPRRGARITTKGKTI